MEVKPYFTLLVKPIFSGIKKTQQTHSFRSKINQLNEIIKAVHLETVLLQSYQITSAVRAILKTDYLKQFYNLNISFSLQFDFSQDSIQQLRIRTAITNYTNVIFNLSRFEAARIAYIDRKISKDIPYSPLELILNLESKITPGSKLFIAVVKN